MTFNFKERVRIAYQSGDEFGTYQRFDPITERHIVLIDGENDTNKFKPEDGYVLALTPEELIADIAKRTPTVVTVKPKRAKGAWSALHLSLAETSVNELIKEYAATGKPVRIGSMAWARRVYAVLGIPLEEQTCAPTTLPGFLETDGYVAKVDGGYIPTYKSFEGLTNKFATAAA